MIFIRLMTVSYTHLDVYKRQAVYGLHVWPDLPHGKIGVKAGPLMAATDHFTIHIHGKTAHGAKPDQGIDAAVLGDQFIVNAQSIVSRRVNPLANAVVTFGIINAGTRYNIIAGDCLLDGTVRLSLIHIFRWAAQRAVPTSIPTERAMQKL